MKGNTVSFRNFICIICYYKNIVCLNYLLYRRALVHLLSLSSHVTFALIFFLGSIYQPPTAEYTVPSFPPSLLSLGAATPGQNTWVKHTDGKF